MKITALTQLMHAVLDGEATPDEARELERHLAADPAARAEFDELRRLFDELSRVPQGLSAGGARRLGDGSRYRNRSGAEAGFRQPFARPRVIGQDFREAPDSSPGISAGVPRFSQQGPNFRSNDMSEEKSGSFGKRKIWIGGAIAAAAVVLAVSSGIDFPPGSKDTAGTIVPAQRYRAPQNTADDVKLGAPGSRAIDDGSSGGDAASTGASQPRPASAPAGKLPATPPVPRRPSCRQRRPLLGCCAGRRPAAATLPLRPLRQAAAQAASAAAAPAAAHAAAPGRCASCRSGCRRPSAGRRQAAAPGRNVRPRAAAVAAATPQVSGSDAGGHAAAAAGSAPRKRAAQAARPRQRRQQQPQSGE